MRKLAFLGAGSVLLALGAAMVSERPGGAQQAPSAVDSATAPSMAAGDTAALNGPRQPIFFRHDIHAGQYKIQCQYCHYSVAVSSEPGIPSLQTCMGCHLVIAGSDSGGKTEIRKLRQFWAEKADPTKPPLEWTRIHALAGHVHFPHSRHIKALGPNACGTCHGDVARMPQVYKVNNVTNMGFCITCHVERNVNRDCTACHY
jgi:hypothetical protein